MPGATPLVTISASESNCLPSSPCTCNKRATKPSKKSKKIPNKTKNAAKVKSPFIAKITAIKPAKRFNNVIKLGMCFLIRFSFGYVTNVLKILK